MRIRMTVRFCIAAAIFWCYAAAQTFAGFQQASTHIPLIDISGQEVRQIVVDREPGQYLGHPDTVVLEDGRTILVVYPKGHGRGGVVMKRSTDGGLTWSDRLSVPENWSTSKETPTIFRTVDEEGVKRLILFSGLFPIRMSHSEDQGQTWTPLEPIGDFGGIVAMSCVVRLNNGNYMALFHDDGRFIREDSQPQSPPVFMVYKTVSADGGLTWSEPEIIATHTTAHLCEPGAIRSPDGKQIAVLLREDSRKFHSFVTFSNDEGETWSEPRELSWSLTGDRHVAAYAPDGRLFITMRDTAQDSPTAGDWIGWVGTYEDIVEGGPGQYRVRLMDNQHGWDCGYAGLEVLPDGSFVSTSYGHWSKDEQPYIVAVRFTLAELDNIASQQAQSTGETLTAPDNADTEASRDQNGASERAEHVIFITTDGLRWQEVFGGVQPDLLNDIEAAGISEAAAERLKGEYMPERTVGEIDAESASAARRRLLMPFMWGVISEEGQIFGDPALNSNAHITNSMKFSYPGYNEMLAGYADDERIDSNDLIPNPNVTVLEWLNVKPEYADNIYAWGSWDAQPYILNVERSGIHANADGQPFAEPLNDSQRTINDMAGNLPDYLNSERFDAITMSAAMECLKTRKPGVMWIMLLETDAWAHERRYDLYLDAAHRVDNFIQNLWIQLQFMPEYASRTTLVISTDHGRGDGVVWTDHGRSVNGAEDVWIAALGPGVSPLGNRANIVVTQSQIAATIAALLGEDYNAEQPKAAAPLPLTVNVSNW